MSNFNASLPRSIAVVKLDDYNEMIHSGKHVAALSDVSAMIVPSTGEIKVNVSEVTRVRELLQSANQLEPGELLIRDPFGDTAYVIVGNAQETLAELAINKYHHMANAVRMLGATGITFADAKVENSSLDVGAKVDTTTPANAKVKANASVDIKKRLQEQLQGSMVFEGSAPDTEQALSYLRKHHLDGDPQLRTLVEMRTAPNLIVSYRLTINSTREFALNVKAAVGLSKVVGIDIGVDYKSITDIQIVTEVVFGFTPPA